jgi:hypothetical protein
VEDDLPLYRLREDAWLDDVENTLRGTFPADLEASIVREHFSVPAATFVDCSQAVGALVYQRMPTYLARRRAVLNGEIDRYSDLPVKDHT